MWSNRPELTRTFPVGLLPHLLQATDDKAAVESFTCQREEVQGQQEADERKRAGREAELKTQASFPLLHSGSSGFGVVEPPRTHSNLPCRPASPFVTVVRGGSVGSNYPKLTPTFPVGLFPLLLQKFREVLPGILKEVLPGILSDVLPELTLEVSG